MALAASEPKCDITITADGVCVFAGKGQACRQLHAPAPTARRPPVSAGACVQVKDSLAHFDNGTGLPITVTVKNMSRRTVKYTPFDSIWFYHVTWLGRSGKPAFPFDPFGYGTTGSHRIIWGPDVQISYATMTAVVTLGPGMSRSHRITIPFRFLKPLGKTIEVMVRIEETDASHFTYEEYSKHFRMPDFE